MSTRKFEYFHFVLQTDDENQMKVFRYVLKNSDYYRPVYIYHTQDRYSEQDLQDYSERNDGAIPNWQVGDLKDPHIHCMVHPGEKLTPNMLYLRFFRWAYVKPEVDPRDRLEYFLHKCLRCVDDVEKGYKHEYDREDLQGDSRVIAMLDSHAKQKLSMKRFIQLAREKKTLADSLEELCDSEDYDDRRAFDEYFSDGALRQTVIAIQNQNTTLIARENARKHVDSPRLDLKQVPLYEKANMAYFKTHYYGGIKKYHWLTIPLALHGVVVLKSGKKVEIAIGEKDSDPVFYITDLLPHLSQELNNAKIGDGFSAENLNLVVGGIPVKGEEKDAVKKNVLALLNAEYGIEEEDFLSAELEAVPAAKARDVGFDRAYIASYGHDDRVCAYPEITATVDADTNETVLTILADKEEIGSVGNTGMQCILIRDILDAIAKNYGVDPAVLRQNSKCISADVTAGFDPAYASAFEEMNASLIHHGVAMSKFTGSRGKSGSNDASAEYVGYLRKVFADAGVIWQTGELGRVDLGGGGTVALFIANNNIDTVDLGVPVLSMHSPDELVSKADVYSAYKAFKAFAE